MRIGCVSDIHGNSPALRAVLSALPGDIETVLFLGDLCGYYPFVEECANLLGQRHVIGVRGNHDQVLLDCLKRDSLPGSEYENKYGSALRRTLQGLTEATKNLFGSLPVSRTIDLNGVTIALFHGAPWDPLEGRVYPDFDRWDRFSEVDSDVVILGQTHYPLEKRIGSKLIVNPGSVGQARDRSGAAAFSILDLDTLSVQQIRVPFDSQELIADAREHDPGLPYLVDVLVRR